MKSISLFLTIIIAFCFLQNTNAQLLTPALSPHAKVEQLLGFTNISVVYERPLAKSRKIFGGLEPFGKVWRTGAGDCTTIKFDEDISFGGQTVAKGKYALFTIPDPNEWTVILNKDTAQHGAFNYDDKKDVLRIKIKPEATQRFYETFTIEITDIQRDYTGVLAIIWENTQIRVPLKSSADERIMADIDRQIVQNKSEKSSVYYNASIYYLNTNRDFAKALAWSRQAESMDMENFYYVNQSTKVLEAMKDYKAAIVTGKRAVEVGTKKGFKATVANIQKKIEQWEQLVK